MTATILRADARALPLADSSVDLIVTSPPYFALRSYTDDGEHYGGQIGSESTPAEYVAGLVSCTRDWVRVLKASGSLWLNLGDKYSGAGPQNAPGRMSSVGNSHHWMQVGKSGIPTKGLMGLPWRYALACIDELGLILRAEVIWSKPNGLPESVTDRVRRSHEQWFHFTAQPRYFAAVDEIRENYAPATATRYAAGYNPRKVDSARPTVNTKLGGDTYGENPLGKLPGSVWSVPTEPLIVPEHLGVDHFAAFPTEWPRRIVLGWSPSGICVECGEGRRPVARRDVIDPRHLASNARQESHEQLAIRDVSASSILRTGLQSGQSPATHITGYACACPDTSAPTRPAVVLDPFGGAGTTALVASVLGRHGVSVDMSADYCRLARWRVNDQGERAKAMRVDKPAAVHDDQMSLLDELEPVS